MVLGHVVRVCCSQGVLVSGRGEAKREATRRFGRGRSFLSFALPSADHVTRNWKEVVR